MLAVMVLSALSSVSTSVLLQSSESATTVTDWVAVAVIAPQVAVTLMVALPDAPSTGLTTPLEETVTGASAAGLSMLHV